MFAQTGSTILPHYSQRVYTPFGPIELRVDSSYNCWLNLTDLKLILSRLIQHEDKFKSAEQFICEHLNIVTSFQDGPLIQLIDIPRLLEIMNLSKNLMNIMISEVVDPAKLYMDLLKTNEELIPEDKSFELSFYYDTNKKMTNIIDNLSSKAINQIINISTKARKHIYKLELENKRLKEKIAQIENTKLYTIEEMIQYFSEYEPQYIVNVLNSLKLCRKNGQMTDRAYNRRYFVQLDGEILKCTEKFIKYFSRKLNEIRIKELANNNEEK